ncbi:unnamed protein product [Clavelina lepadiformis]|uniref:Major facilitator superfamily (MFS) profile domain-containing protein n=1 Tax=Clavelina lepadiformis TaxID=159417 RepID=A0ABP0G835_CLALP
MDCLEQLRSCKLIATVIVASMILIDFTLLTAIVPVIPTYLWEIHLRSNPDLYKSNNNLSISAMNLTSSSQASNSQNLKEAEKTYLATQSVKIAAIIAAKPAVQVIANFFVGPLVDRIGYRVPMTAAALIICTTAVGG